MDNLPVDLTSTVGRRAETAEVRRLLSESRLVTLTGVGGVGKTRLALHVARRLRRAFRDGVWLVELAELAEPDLLAVTVMHAIGLNTRSRDLMAALAGYLGEKQILLVFDNCEHLVNACARLVTELLQACPDLRVLTTSRESLRASGEVLFTVPPLPTSSADAPSGGDGYGSDAADLFLERADAAVPGFVVTREEKSVIAKLCRRLDGLPLAIELAAPRLRTLSPQQLLDRLEDRFRVLTHGDRVTLRHRTLRAAVDWSFEMCSEREQVMWARASVFAGDFDLETAESVCSGEDLADGDVLEQVAALVDKSILTREEVSSRQRYRLLETIRQYGQEKLRERGEEFVLRCRHRDHYLRLAEQVYTHWFGPAQEELFARVAVERENIRAALDFCLTEPGQSRFGLRIAGALWPFWLVGSGQREGRYWLNCLLSKDTEPSPERITALWVNAHVSALLGEDTAARAMLAECRELARRVDDRVSGAHATRTFGFVELLHNNAARAVALLQESVRGYRAVGDRGLHLAGTLSILALAACANGEADLAVEAAQEGQSLAADHRERWVFSRCSTYRSLAESIQGHHRQAVELARKTLREKWVEGDLLAAALAVEVLALAEVSEGHAERAARFFGAEGNLWEPLGPYLLGADFLLSRHAAGERQVKQILGETAFLDAARSGEQLTMRETIAFAIGERAAPRAAAESSDGYPTLTRRENQVAGLVALGLSNKDIAAKLVISRRTAETHVEHILIKLGFTSRAQVATWYSERRRQRTGPVSSD